jgi:AcrR family transcriptional regulator
MDDDAGAGPGRRGNQRRRTRKDLLRAAASLIREGRRPSVEEVAAAAMVSRATAYRHFPDAEALLLEAALDVAVPGPEALFGPGAEAPPEDDPVGRVLHVEAALHAMILAHEAQLRLMLAHSLRPAPAAAGMPRRQNRRTPLIEAALAPACGRFDPAALDRLQKALALVLGPEAMVVFRDVLQLDAEEAAAVKRWAIRALVETAMAG